jgi:hypothetical protein
MVSHERICQFIREDKKKGGALCKHLRHRLKHRKRPVGGKKIIYRIKYPLICVPILSVKKNVSVTGKSIPLLALKTKAPFSPQRKELPVSF